MTFFERYGTFEAFQTEKALKAIAHLQEGKYYSDVYHKTVNLFERPEYLMTKAEKEEKKKILETISRLQTYVSGKAVNPVWFAEWNYLKDTEYPSWRE